MAEDEAVRAEAWQAVYDAAVEAGLDEADAAAGADLFWKWEARRMAARRALSGADRG